MKAFLLPSLLAASLFLSPAQEKRKQRPPEVEVVELRTHRGEGQLTIDGKIRNEMDQPLRGLVLFFALEASRHEVVATKNGVPEPEDLAPGEEAEFHVETSDPVRAVYIRVEARDKRGVDLRLGKNGPFPIE